MKIALIGTRMMGACMAGRLLDAGHELAVCHRTRARSTSWRRAARPPRR